MIAAVDGRDVVLVVADDTDTTADGVCAVLAERHRPYFRFDTADVPGRLQLDLRLEPDERSGPLWTGQLRRPARPGEDRARDPRSLAEVDLSRVRSVYLRRPRPFEVPAHLTAAERWHAATESRYGLGGVLASLPVPQLNHPSCSADAAYKPRQLAELRACGLTVPFVASEYAVRLIVVGHALFAVRIDAHSDRARADWRSDYDHLTYQPTVLPEDVVAGVRAYMALAGLHYGAWDFLGHADGRFTALECNPEGNYAWLEDVTSVRITEAIAGWLADPTTQGAPGVVAPGPRRMVS